MKRCPKCEKTLPRSDFYTCKKSKTGLQSHCKSCLKKRNRDYHKRNLRERYNLTPEDYENMAFAQDYKCAICNEPPANTKRRLAVDHCHDTGHVRGLLCLTCNSGIGKLNDDPELVLAAYNYLIKHKAIQQHKENE